ncbi:MAG: hypothetical protein HW418_4122, partial [Anaerolineales bacterium]|nr:hypothetical protein [Anaerolineales bacterium]
GFLIAVVGLNLGMTLLRGQTMPDVLTPEYYFELAVYLVAAPVLFFLPLWSVHARMAVAKQKLLAEIAEQFELEYRSLLDGLRRNELKLDDVARLEAIQKVYKIAQASPAWPFDLEIVSKFGAAVLLPLLLPMSVDVLVNVLMR